MADPTQTAAWKALRAHHEEVADLLFDYYRTHKSSET
jgi:hypothetical protein